MGLTGIKIIDIIQKVRNNMLGSWPRRCTLSVVASSQEAVMKGEVFIAWGENLELAEAVEAKLDGEGYKAQVGGCETNCGKSGFYLGQQIMAQLKRASRAIILAQPSADGSLTFRPNLMLEWGFLMARLSPARVHVFLIGVNRSDLPSDLQGSWSTEIALDEIDSMAGEVVKTFTGSVCQASVEASEIFCMWPTWRAWIERQLSGEDAPDYLMLAGVLLHSVQPAFYNGELQVLMRALEVASTLHGPPELRESVRISRAACDYNLGVELAPGFAELNFIADRLEPPLDTHVEQGALMHWLETVRLDFLGLCYWQMVSTTPADNERRNLYMTQAKDAFQKACGFLDKIKDEKATQLWKGYILRNLGRISMELKDDSGAKTCLKNALDARQRAYGDLKAAGMSEIPLSMYSLEITATRIDLLAYGYDGGASELIEAIDLLKKHQRLTGGTFGMWNLAVAEAERACTELKRPDLLGTVETLKYK